MEDAALDAYRCLRDPDARALIGDLPDSWFFDRSTRIRVTGFGPFLTHRFNPSSIVGTRIAATLRAAEFDAQFEELDVTFDIAREWGRQNVKPNTFVIHVGLAATSTVVRVERYAHNVRPTIADNRGVIPRKLAVGGPVARETGVDVRDLVGRLSRTVPAEESRDAGTYVCNAILWGSLEVAATVREMDAAADAVFVHVPPWTADESAVAGDKIGAAFTDYFRTAWCDEVTTS